MTLLYFFLVFSSQFCITCSAWFPSCSYTKIFIIVTVCNPYYISFHYRQTGKMVKCPCKKNDAICCLILVIQGNNWANISLTLNPVLSTECWQPHVFGVPMLCLDLPFFIYLNTTPCFFMNMLEIFMKPNILTIYHKCTYLGNNQDPMLMNEIPCWYVV